MLQTWNNLGILSRRALWDDCLTLKRFEPSLHSERKGPSWRHNPIRLWSTCSRWLSAGLGQWNSLREYVLVCFKRKMNIFKVLPGLFFCFLLVYPRRPFWKKELLSRGMDYKGGCEIIMTEIFKNKIALRAWDD